MPRVPLRFRILNTVLCPFSFDLNYTVFTRIVNDNEISFFVTNTGDKAARDSAHMFNNSSCTNSCIEKASSKLPVFERAKLPNHGNSRTKTVLQTELLLIWFIIWTAWTIMNLPKIQCLHEEKTSTHRQVLVKAADHFRMADTSWHLQLHKPVSCINRWLWSYSTVYCFAVYRW